MDPLNENQPDVNPSIASFTSAEPATPSPNPTTPADQVEPPQPSVEQSHIRTFQGDVAHAMQKKEASVVKIALAESKRSTQTETIGTRAEAPRVSSNSKNSKLLIISLILICIGAGVLAYVYFVVLTPRLPEHVQSTLVPSIISADKQKEFDIATPNISSVIVSEIQNAQLGVNQIENLFFTRTVETNKEKTKEVVDTPTFLSLINATAPTSFVRSLAPEFMFGIQGLEKNEPFLILTTHEYESAYAGMLKWEPTLYEDFKRFIISSPITVDDQASTTDITTEDLLGNKTTIEDRIVRNKDVRVVYDKNKNVVLLYSFIDRNTLLITSNETTLQELLNRFEQKVYTR